MHSALLEALDQGALVLTGNNRLARGLSQAYQARQQAAGKTVWAAPNVLPLSAWLRSLWAKSLGGTVYGWQQPEAGRRILSANEEALVWGDIVANSDQANALLHSGSIAKAAQQASAIVYAAASQQNDWLPDASAAAPEHKAFAEWLTQFEALCEQRGWTSESGLAGVIARFISDCPVALPQQLCTIGFDEFTASQQSLWQALTKRSISVQHYAANTDLAVQANARRLGCDDSRSEIHTAARWALQKLQNAESPNSASIGIVALDLDTQRAEIEHQFRRVFTPALGFSRAGANDEAAQHFNISLGLPLSEWPLSRLALDWLHFAIHGLELNALGRLLRQQHYRGGVAEAEQRAMLDVLLRKDGRLQWRIGHLLAALEKDRSKMLLGELPELQQALTAARQLGIDAPRKAAPSAWCAWLNEFFRTIAWPSDTDTAASPQRLSGDQHQLLGAWDDLLDDIAGLDEVLGDIDARQFLSQLESQAKSSLFQPRSANAPVQIMGLLEASGAEFDALWVMGMSDAAWPTAARPNPLLPLQWQRRHKAPHASVERELTYARQVTQQLAVAAPEVVFSWPRNNGDEELRHSPMLNSYCEVSADDLALADVEDAVAMQMTALTDSSLVCVEEGADDWVALPGFDIQQAGQVAIQVAGGTRVIEDQSACAFRAFAKHRLGAEPLEEPSFGIDSRARGSNIHKALELLWQRLKKQAALLDLDELALQAMVEGIVSDVVQEQSLAAEASAYEQRLAQVEIAVLTRLLLEWLELDKQRAPFHSVATENPTVAAIGPLRLHTVADRIDTQDDGSKVLIDYKNSKHAKYAAWFSERPEQPQMPIYAVSLTADEQTVAAVLYANVVTGECRYQGVTDEADLAPGVKPIGGGKEPEFESVEVLYENWQRSLSNLAIDFAQGIAVVDPKNEHSCRYCGLQALCRVAAVPLAASQAAEA